MAQRLLQQRLTTRTSLVGLGLLISGLMGCTALVAEPNDPAAATLSASAQLDGLSRVTQAAADSARIMAIEISGKPQTYNFAVTVQSPDTGCDRYADWWEVVSIDGNLLYRRILQHSHVSEQPFTRSGGPVPINESDSVVIRVHMHPEGYSPIALRGSINEGFESVELPLDFAPGLDQQPPLPSSCAF